MPLTARVAYQGNLRTQMTHLASQQEVTTDAPVDNNGLGQAFSPTDLVASALASCAMTIMGIAARRENLAIDGATIAVTKTMAANPRRIIQVDLQVHIPQPHLTADQRQLLEAAALTCPVAHSLHPDIKQVFTFTYE